MITASGFSRGDLTSLKTLGLEYNTITNVGMEALCQAFHQGLSRTLLLLDQWYKRHFTITHSSIPLSNSPPSTLLVGATYEMHRGGEFGDKEPHYLTTAGAKYAPKPSRARFPVISHCGQSQNAQDQATPEKDTFQPSLPL